MYPRKALELEPIPLYVELLANIAKDLNSFADMSLVRLPRNCEEGIVMLFDRLEAKHGRVLVSRAFGYMVASSTGMSDCEIEVRFPFFSSTIVNVVVRIFNIRYSRNNIIL